MKTVSISVLSLTFILTSSSVKANQHHNIEINHNRNIGMIASVENESKKCRYTINSIVKEVQKTSGNLGVKRLNVRRNLSGIWSNGPKGDLFDLDIGANQKISWFSDNDKMQKIATKIVKNCPDTIGVVVSTEGDYLYAYGLVDEKIKKFICPRSNKMPFRWGFYSGGCR
jgi:hypothetical protein